MDDDGHVCSLMYARSSRLSKLQLNQPLKNVSLSSLNGDVLHEIVSYLRGRDALNLSLTTRRVHDFAFFPLTEELLRRRQEDPVVHVHRHLEQIQLSQNELLHVYLEH